MNAKARNQSATGDRISGERIQRSWSFRAARKRAIAYARDAALLNDLVDRATRKLAAMQHRFDEVRDGLGASFRLLRAYAAGRYRAIPWSSLVSIVAAIVYFVMPLDAIPDFILSLGFIDDVALIGWVLSSVRRDLDAFTAWENRGAQDPEKIEKR